MEKRENFGNRMAVIMAMAGSAIGLGNIWRFPYMVGEHGGAAFVMVYILSTVIVSLPVFIAEVSIGRRSRTSAYGSFSRLAPGKPLWKFVGLLAVAIPTLISSYYSVIGGWSLAYLGKSCAFSIVKTAPESVGSIFTEFISSSWAPIIVHLIFLFACALIVAMGVKSGIEKFSKITIPALFALIVAMIIYSVTLPGAGAGVSYLLKPDFRELTPRTFAFAMGQSFYSLSLGMGAIVTYGSYVKKSENIVASAVGTAVSDLIFAILAGLAIMPAVFAGGIEPGAGPGLIFQSIPYIFSTLGTKLPILSSAISIIFFLAIVVAAMTSCISIMEVGVAYLKDRFEVKRSLGSLVIFLLCGFLGVLCSLSFGPLSGFKIGGMCLFDLFDWFSSNILLLLMGFAVVIFTGFVMKKEDVRDEITNSGTKQVNEKLFDAIYFLIKWVAPVAVLLIFVTNFIL